jgi:hypothetical protein
MTRRAALAELERRATDLLELEPPTVVRKQTLPPSGDIHDYISFAPYWWPNQDTPDGMPWVQRDGHVNPRTRDISDKHGWYSLLDLVWMLGHAYRELGGREYAEKAAACLRVWFLEPATRMNPNLNFGQGVPGAADGRPAGLIETREIGKLLGGVLLLEGSPAWSAHDTDSIREWVRAFLDWLALSPLAEAERKANNNHATWYFAQAAAMLEFAGERKRALEMVGDSRTLVDRQIQPDGSQPQEVMRANSRHYCMFNLLGFCRLAELADGMGASLWQHKATSGASLRCAFEHLVANWDAWPLPTLAPMPADGSEFAEVLYHSAGHYGGIFRERWDRTTEPGDLNELFWGTLPAAGRSS